MNSFLAISKKDTIFKVSIIVNKFHPIMAKIYNLSGSIKKYFLLTLFVSIVLLSYSQTMNQEPNNENQGSSITTFNQSEKTNWKRRYQILVEAGYQYQIFGKNTSRVKFNLAQSYYFNSYTAAGAGVGMRYYYDADLFLFPIFIHFRARMLEASIAPYFSMGMGVSTVSNKGLLPMGLCLNPELGFLYTIKEDLELYFTVGFELQNLHFIETEYDYGIGSKTVNLDAFSVSIGVAF